MRIMKRRVAVPVAVALAIAAAATVLVSSASGGPEAKVAKGGTYRVGWESSFGWTDSFDPTGEYLANAFAINTNLLLRGLIGYNHVGGPAGSVIVPDLATKVPKPTNGGKRYTFTLKSGVRWGPPLNRAITAQDVKYARRAAGAPEERRPVRVLLHDHQGLGRVQQGQDEVASRHQDAEREDGHLRPHCSRRVTS